MIEGNGLVEWFVPVTFRMIVGHFVRGWEAIEYCEADWQCRSTPERQFAFSLHLRLTSFSCVVWHTHRDRDMHTHRHNHSQTNMLTSWCCLSVEPDLWHIYGVWVTASQCFCVRRGNSSKRIPLNRPSKVILFVVNKLQYLKRRVSSVYIFNRCIFL